MDYDYQVYLLSSKFFKENEGVDFLHKPMRPYNCLLIELHDYFVCVPFRSSIKHNNAFIFKGTQRSKRTRSGLDYSKIVIVKNHDYIESSIKPIVDQDEYVQMVKNMPVIVTQVHKYIDTYTKHIKQEKILHPKTFERKYKFSSLKYFNDILTGTRS